MTLRSVFICDPCKEEFIADFPRAKKQAPGTGLCKCCGNKVMADGTFFLVSVVESGPRK